jgi:1,2-dihydroxy-3-keto-5-methylthiopentene dioxygenase
VSPEGQPCSDTRDTMPHTGMDAKPTSTIHFPLLLRGFSLMASVHIPDEERCLTSADDISAFLKPFGIWYERWEVAGRLKADATDAEILSEYAPEIEKVKAAGGFVTADVINVHPSTPNLDAMLAKFNQEHTHSEDEVRFTVEGKGVFHLHPENGPVFSVTVETGDMINVPRGTKHWFNLCDDRHIRCIRFFEDATGWTPHYVDDAVHGNYSPMCFGPNFVGKPSGIEPIIKT